MPEDSHYTEKCVKILENPELPKVILEKHITGPTIQEEGDIEIKTVEYDTCLEKGYKFNTLSLILKEGG